MRLWVWKLAFRYLFPKGRCGTFFTWMSLLGIATGVALLCVVLSIMNGFDEHIEQKLVQIHGPIKVISNQLIGHYEALQEKIQALPHVKAVTPFVQGVALVQCGGRVAFPKCLGLDFKTAPQVLPLSKFIIKEDKTLEENDAAYIASPLSQELGLQIGDTFDLYSPLSLEAIKNDEMILPQEIRLRGFFKTGWAEVDRDTLLFPLPVLQATYGLQGQVHGFSIDADRKHLADVCQQLNRILPESARAYTWNRLNEDFLYVLKMEKMLCFFVLLFIVAVASFSMSSGLMAAVVRKRREIALLRTWGARRCQIITLFECQSLLLSTLGILCGLGSAILILHYRNAIVQLLTGWFLPRDVLWNFYDIEQLPVAYHGKDFLLIVAFTFIITTVASFIPAVKAIRTPTLQGLRSE